MFNTFYSFSVISVPAWFCKEDCYVEKLHIIRLSPLRRLCRFLFEVSISVSAEGSSSHKHVVQNSNKTLTAISELLGCSSFTNSRRSQQLNLRAPSAFRYVRSISAFKGIDVRRMLNGSQIKYKSSTLFSNSPKMSAALY
jgi:hypothetical protein